LKRASIHLRRHKVPSQEATLNHWHGRLRTYPLSY